MSDATQGYQDDPLAFLAGGGEMGRLIRSMDWSETPLGPVKLWPQSLRTTVSLCLASNFPINISWGPGHVQIYNDGYWPICGGKHPRSMGQDFSECWASAWPAIGEAFAQALAGHATFLENQRMFLDRNGYLEETFFTFSFSPIRDESGGVGGLFHPVTETTVKMLSERRTRALRDVSAHTGKAKSVEEVLTLTAKTLADYGLDLPFVLLYAFDVSGSQGRLVGTSGLTAGTFASPELVDLGAAERCVWPLEEAVNSGSAVQVDDLGKRLGPPPYGPYDEPPNAALVLPILPPGADRPVAVLVFGVSPRLPLDEAYRSFYELIASSVTAAIANALAHEEERRRADVLADLDRAKIAFFSNVSHEFRTPLTLMLGPVEDMLARSYSELTPAAKSQLEIVNRNGLRLLRLVNTLLDFSRIEAGRVRAVYQPTDLATFTADLTSVFRSACERAGLRLIVDCPKPAERVFVDRDMWEKVVLNLLSNAFKFTLDGEIAVTLRQVGGFAELVVRDTGTGVPAAEVPRLFERFHRVENARGRTHEGSGIGLALVQELVKLHGGSVNVESVENRGTTFVVTLPLGSAHLPSDQIAEVRTLTSAGVGASPYVEEALGWLPDDLRGERDYRSELPTYQEPLPTPCLERERASVDDRPYVLLADDNADMREYVGRLLAEHYCIQTVPDGETALVAARERTPDLIVTDVMMPRLDGFGLLRELRADSRTQNVPVIMLSARAGEEARVEGMEAGADDYLIKPFGARELLARVAAHLQMAQMRRDASEASRQSGERLRIALTAARMVAWEWTPADGKLHVSANAADLFGLPAGSSLFGIDQGLALIHPADVEAYQETYQRAIAERGNYLTQYRLVRPDDGTVLWMEERGHTVFDGPGGAVRLFGVVSDITDRIGAEQALRASEEQRRLALDSAELGAWHIDPAANTMTSDERFQQIFSGTAGTISYEQAFALIHPDDRDRIRAAVAAATRPDDPAPYAEEYRVIHPEGVVVRWVFGKGRTNFEGTGSGRRLVSFDATVADITERKQLEAELRQLAANLSDADRRKDEFLATLAHELRNPLAPLRNGLQVMKLAKNNAEAVEQCRAMMERQLGQMVRLIDDLLDVSRISRGKVELKKERVDLAKVVQQAVESSRPLIEHGSHELVVNVSPEPLYVDADVTRLAQVYANLLNNAAKYTEPGGRIRLTVERQGSDAVVTVRDNGVGIAANMLPKVFELFTQVDRSLEKSQGGLGIGLSLVKSLSENARGS
jgi:PAS domain S-box-containing protein